MPTLQHQFGRKLRELRLAHNWTQEQLAERLEVSINFLSYMERGIKAPSFPNLERIARTFQVTVSTLFEISPPNSEGSADQKGLYGTLRLLHHALGFRGGPTER